MHLFADLTIARRGTRVPSCISQITAVARSGNPTAEGEGNADTYYAFIRSRTSRRKFTISHVNFGESRKTNDINRNENYSGYCVPEISGEFRELGRHGQLSNDSRTRTHAPNIGPRPPNASSHDARKLLEALDWRR